MKTLTIAIGCDHAGFEYKETIKKALEGMGHIVKDFGTYSTASVDYPDFVHPVAIAVEQHESAFGILLCGSANGVAMTANKHQGIRAGLCWNQEVAVLTRQHNNANILCIPARFMTIEQAVSITETFLVTPFEAGRHQLRVDKIALKC
jgi:ribose 5-phosphate isomerase B